MAVLITLAFGIPIVMRERGIPFLLRLRDGVPREWLAHEWLVLVFWVIWPTLLFTSIAFFWFQRRTLAIVGLVSALLSGAFVCMPVLAK